jgi:hypothetical protein
MQIRRDKRDPCSDMKHTLFIGVIAFVVVCVPLAVFVDWVVS